MFSLTLAGYSLTPKFQKVYKQHVFFILLHSKVHWHFFLGDKVEFWKPHSLIKIFPIWFGFFPLAGNQSASFCSWINLSCLTVSFFKKWLIFSIPFAYKCHCLQGSNYVTFLTGIASVAGVVVVVLKQEASDTSLAVHSIIYQYWDYSYTQWNHRI